MFPDWSGSEGSKVVSRIKEFRLKETYGFPETLPFNTISG